MAKKTFKAKAVKKAVKPAKKAAAPKKAVKPLAKKASAKKIVKPVKGVKLIKKASAKKPIKPAKDVVKKVVKKAAPAKAVGKKVANSKTSKTGNKVAASMPARPVKKVAPKAAPKPVKPAAKAASPAKPKAGVVQKVVNAVKNILGKKDVKKTEPAPKNVAKQSSNPAPVSKAPAPSKPAVTTAPRVEKRTETREVKQEVKVDEAMEKKKQESSAKNPVNKNARPPQPKPQVNTDTRTRYSDAELQEFKELILKKLDEAQKDYELLKSTLSHKDDHGTDDTSPTFKLLEDGSDVLSKEETAHLAARQEKFIQALQNALIRIENKTYGICRVTGKLISKERLRSVPHATLSIDAKLGQNA